MTIQTINPGSAPIVWSTIDDAFAVINDNFTSLVATIGDYGVTPIDFSSLSTNVSPSVDGEYSLGSPEKRWRDLHLLGSSIYIGDAIINSTGTSVNLPAGSTIGGTILDSEFFKEIAVSGQSNVVADPGGSDVLTLVASTGVGITTDAAADSITFTNTGVTSAVAGTGISVSGATGAVTITNAGVVTNVAGAGITVSAASGNVTISNAGIISVVTDPGSGISLDTSVPNTVRVTNSAPNISQDTFKSVAVAGQTTVVADSANDTLTLVAGTGIAITTNDTTDSITISSVLVTEFDLKGSVFADDSTMLVDATDGVLRGTLIGTVAGTLKGSVFADDSTQIIDGNSFTVYGNIEATTLRTAETKIALGDSAGQTNQGISAVAVGGYAGTTNQGSDSVAVGLGAGNDTQGIGAVAVGREAGSITQGIGAVAVGEAAGYENQGANAIAIGVGAGFTSQHANSIILNASGSPVNSDGTGRFFVDPIRTSSAGAPLMYNSTTKEITYSNVLEFIGSTISTSDSSGLTVDVQTTFNTDVTFDNDIAVNGQVTIGGDLIVNGTTTTINSVTLTVDDKNIELGSTASPTDTTADGGGITLRGSTDKTFTYVNSTGLWTANIGVAATSFTGLAVAATTASTAASVGYMGLPQSAITTTDTLTIADAGKHIYVNTASQTITIPANSAVPYPIGTAITFVAGPSATTVLIANNDTMYLTGSGTTGTRTLAVYGSATAIKVSATVWFIAGTGLT